MTTACCPEVLAGGGPQGLLVGDGLCDLSSANDFMPSDLAFQALGAAELFVGDHL